jgi:hypothetical protein
MQPQALLSKTDSACENYWFSVAWPDDTKVERFLIAVVAFCHKLAKFLPSSERSNSIEWDGVERQMSENT